MNAEFLFYCMVCGFIFILSFFLVVKFLEDLSDKSAERRTQELINKLKGRQVSAKSANSYSKTWAYKCTAISLRRGTEERTSSSTLTHSK